MKKMKVITMCGSMRYASEMIKIASQLELEFGYLVIQCVYFDKNKNFSQDEINCLNQIHYKKIDLSDAIYVVNIDSYIGNSTQSEINYALKNNKEVIYHVK